MVYESQEHYDACMEEQQQQMKCSYEELEGLSRKLSEVPSGYEKIKSATTGIDGYEWYSNGKSRFSKEYRSILVKPDIDD